MVLPTDTHEEQGEDRDMKLPLNSLRPAAVILLVTASLVSLPGTAAAGCLREFGNCGDCAEAALRSAIWSLDLGGIADAYVDGIDCDLDLMHCILWGQHHNYSCSI